jgi:hypothetical protein
MHREDNSRFLLYIEPDKSLKNETPTYDAITSALEDMLMVAKKGTANYDDLNGEPKFREGSGWKGVHTTDSGQSSTSYDYLLPNGMITNSLCVYYAAYYWGSIPKTEVEKLNDLVQWASENRDIIIKLKNGN